MIDMARKDNKGRNLKTGEYQRPDGRYEYRYKDEITWKRNSVYAADLASLREMEKKINKEFKKIECESKWKIPVRCDIRHAQLGKELPHCRAVALYISMKNPSLSSKLERGIFT